VYGLAKQEGDLVDGQLVQVLQGKNGAVGRRQFLQTFHDLWQVVIIGSAKPGRVVVTVKFVADLLKAMLVPFASAIVIHQLVAGDTDHERHRERITAPTIGGSDDSGERLLREVLSGGTIAEDASGQVTVHLVERSVIERTKLGGRKQLGVRSCRGGHHIPFIALADRDPSRSPTFPVGSLASMPSERLGP
jgi:hypothetical protein